MSELKSPTCRKCALSRGLRVPGGAHTVWEGKCANCGCDGPVSPSGDWRKPGGKDETPDEFNIRHGIKKFTNGNPDHWLSDGEWETVRRALETFAEFSVFFRDAKRWPKEDHALIGCSNDANEFCEITLSDFDDARAALAIMEGRK